MARRQHSPRTRAHKPLVARPTVPPIEALARTASEAGALLSRLAEVSERAVAALDRGDTETLFSALAERDPLRERLTSLVRALSSARVALVADARRAAEARTLVTLMSPVERLAARAGAADARLAQLAAARREELAKTIGARRED